jgi:hypothetical protein
MPAIAVDWAVSLQPSWMIVYGSLSVFVLLPLLVVRDQQLFRRVLQAWVTVFIVAYVGFLVYPTVAPLRALGVIGMFGLVVACLWVPYRTRMVVV